MDAFAAAQNPPAIWPSACESAPGPTLAGEQVSAQDRPLVALGQALRTQGYDFTTITLASHQRVNARRPAAPGVAARRLRMELPVCRGRSPGRHSGLASRGGDGGRGRFAPAQRGTVLDDRQSAVRPFGVPDRAGGRGLLRARHLSFRASARQSLRPPGHVALADLRYRLRQRGRRTCVQRRLLADRTRQSC